MSSNLMLLFRSQEFFCVQFPIPSQGSAIRFENHAYFIGRKSYSNTNKRSYVSNKETTEHVK